MGTTLGPGRLVQDSWTKVASSCGKLSTATHREGREHKLYYNVCQQKWRNENCSGVSLRNFSHLSSGWVTYDIHSSTLKSIHPPRRKETSSLIMEEKMITIILKKKRIVTCLCGPVVSRIHSFTLIYKIFQVCGWVNECYMFFIFIPKSPES